MSGRARTKAGMASHPAAPFPPPAFAELPDDFRPDTVYRERRATLGLERLEGRTLAPRLVEEAGLRLSGLSGDSPFALVVDAPGEQDLARIGAVTGAWHREAPEEIASVVLPWIPALADLFDRWERAIPGAGGEVTGVRMEASASRRWIEVTSSPSAPGEAGDSAPWNLGMTARGSIEARITLTLRGRGRTVSVEEARWAALAGEPSAGTLAACEEAAELAVRRAADLLEAMPAPAMEAAVLFTPEAAGVLLHEIVGHLLEADLVVGGASPFAGRLGEKVAPPEVTLLDDPLRRGARVAMAMDDQGEEAGSKILVRKGILAGYLSDRRTAAATGGRSTGNARRESYRHAARPRMTNLVLEPGPADPAELLRGIRRGLLVERLGRGQVDPRRGEFSLEVESARFVEEGRAGRSVTRSFLVGTCRDLLAAIDGVGGDPRPDRGAGACIKDDQIVPVGSVAPSVRVARVRIVPGAAS